MQKNTTLTTFNILMGLLISLFTINANSIELPGNFPPFDIKTLDKPAPGIMLFATRGSGYGSYLVITDSAANVLKYRPATGVTSNFAVQPNGQITFNTVVQGYFKAYSEARIYIADSSLTVIDSIVSGNGFVPAPHSSEILPNGNYLYSSFEAHHVDMSKVVENGNPNAIVAGAILVEMDIYKNVVFQWRSWDYIDIADTYQPINDFLNIITLYSNFNSVAVDPDGNYLICNRLLSEITKVDRNTGDIIWRLGGKHNQFTFIIENENNSPIYFSMQHDVRILANGNLTIFDNGDQHDPPYSRGVEYVIDEESKTAKMVWEYVAPVDVFSQSNGSLQKQPNGNLLIGWGNTTTNQDKLDITEVNPEGKVEFEMSLPKAINAFKAVKFPYPIGKHTARVMKEELLPLNTYTFNSQTAETGVTTVFSSIEGFMYNAITVSKYNYAPLYPKFEKMSPIVAPYRYEFEKQGFDVFSTEVRFNLDGMEWIFSPELYKVYVRDTIGSGFFKPLTTTYNTETNELIANTTILGEFIFAKNYAVSPPEKAFLSLPENKQSIENGTGVQFAWSPKGYFRSSTLLVSDDKEFKTFAEFPNLKETKLMVSDLEPNTTYYWKVAVSNDYEQGLWSDVYEFTIGEPFINITYPNGGEVWVKDTIRKFINWEKNITEPVKIDLLRNGAVEYSISDSLVSFTGAFAFKIPGTVIEDSTYQVRVSLLNDSEINGISSEFFTIKNSATSVNSQDDYSDISISNYPNPASKSTTFEIVSPNSGFGEIKLYDANGNFIQTIFSGQIESGSFSIDWTNGTIANGVYHYRFILGNFITNEKLIISR